MTEDPHALNQPALEADPSPSAAGTDARAWLAMLEEAKKTFRDYQDRADNIDKLYSDLRYLANGDRDREFALFWANVQVLGPSIYSRPPVPVVVPRFKDRRPLYRTASELLERCTIVAFELADIDQTMLLIRDDLTISARGVAWVRLEDEDGQQKVCLEHLDRRDFLHEPARNWSEVGWVARRAWLTKDEVRKRFGTKYADEVTYHERPDERDNGGADDSLQADIWEIWHKRLKRVVWVSENCEIILDSDKPHLKLDGFFPCPRPAYATTQRRSLIPVPDMVFYRDQLEEINALTRRIHALQEALRVKGFYPAGQSDIGDAVETAMQVTDDRKVMVPVANFAAFGGQGGEVIVWLPIDMVATTIQTLVALRKDLIDDVYQITGLSDIMRGSTDANETLGAQELKSQYGSVRIRDRQGELVRVARDLVRIVAEIMAENFSAKALVEMSQLEIPSDADIRRQANEMKAQAKAQLEQQIAQAQQDPQMMQQAQADPQAAQAMLQQAIQQMEAQLAPQIEKLKTTPTVEKVTAFLKDQRLRPFVLDIETDSTIAPDENAQKQRATEFLTAVGGAIGQAAPVMQMLPQLAPVFSDMLKFIASQYRAGRDLEGSIEEFADQMKQMAAQPQGNPEADAAKAAAEAEQQKMQMQAQADQSKQALEQAKAQSAADVANAKSEADRAKTSADLEALRIKTDAEVQKMARESDAKARESQMKLAEMAAKSDADRQAHEQAMQKGTLELEKLRREINRVVVQTDATAKAAEAKANEPKTKVS